jgi:hypothetical protein
MKKPIFGKGGEAVGWAACREAACQWTNETLPKDLERQPLVIQIQTCQGYESFQFNTSGDFP